MATKTFNVSMDEELLKQVDKAAKAEYASRSDYLRSAVMDKLKSSKPEDKLQGEYKQFVAQYGQTLKNLAKR